MISSSNMVNINVPTQTLRGFDRLCRLVGKTRTSILVDLMRSFVLQEGQRIMEQVRQISSLAECGDKPDKTSVERRSEPKTSDPSKRIEKTIQKRFSDFLKD
jgi:hypothetical protein